MATEPADVVEVLRRAGADPAASHRALGATLTQSGEVCGSVKVRREGIRQFKALSGLTVDPELPDSKEWLPRFAAAEYLGVSVKRIDKLRQQGRLTWRRLDYVGSVYVSRQSIAEYDRTRRRLGTIPRLSE